MFDLIKQAVDWYATGPHAGWTIIVLVVVSGIWWSLRGEHDWTWEGWDSPGIEDVPCQPCQRGYGEQHVCTEPRHCACDQEVKHIQHTPITDSIRKHFGFDETGR